MIRDHHDQRRDVAQTAEPAGQPGTGEQHRFVVQEHHARHLHYDFRLELGGGLRSWAVPKGPPSWPDERRLAVAVADHPVDYLAFEGTIPQGQYGAGTVRIWDHGTFTMETTGPDALTFVLHGEKLRGRYALIRMKRCPRDWLFLKLSDDENSLPHC